MHCICKCVSCYEDWQRESRAGGNCQEVRINKDNPGTTCAYYGPGIQSKLGVTFIPRGKIRRATTLNVGEHLEIEGQESPLNTFPWTLGSTMAGNRACPATSGYLCFSVPLERDILTQILITKLQY